jgi:hypothetical protein
MNEKEYSDYTLADQCVTTEQLDAMEKQKYALLRRIEALESRTLNPLEQNELSYARRELAKLTETLDARRPGLDKDDEAKAGEDFPAIEQIPYVALEQIGAIFSEGEPIYGRDNWKKGVHNKKYQRKRLRHAIRHLMLYAGGDRSENHLAKVAWFCVTQLYLTNEEDKIEQRAVSRAL